MKVNGLVIVMMSIALLSTNGCGGGGGSSPEPPSPRTRTMTVQVRTSDDNAPVEGADIIATLLSIQGGGTTMRHGRSDTDGDWTTELADDVGIGAVAVRWQTDGQLYHGFCKDPAWDGPTTVHVARWGPRLYTSNWMPDERRAVTVLTADTGSVLGHISGPSSWDPVAFAPADGRGYFAGFTSELFVIDLRSNSELARIPLPEDSFPSEMLIDEDSDTGYITLPHFNGVAVFRLSTDQRVHVVGLGPEYSGSTNRGPRELALSADGQFLFVTDLRPEGSVLHQVSIGDWVVTRTIMLDEEGAQREVIDGERGVVYWYDHVRRSLRAMDITTETVVASCAITDSERTLSSLELTPDGSILCATDIDGDVVFLRTDDLTEEARIDFPDHVDIDNIVFSSDGQIGYLGSDSHYTGCIVSVIDMSSYSVVDELPTNSGGNGCVVSLLETFPRW